MRQSQAVPALLVVDDMPSIRELLIHTLRSLVPDEIIAVTDATAALAVLATRPGVGPRAVADHKPLAADRDARHTG